MDELSDTRRLKHLVIPCFVLFMLGNQVACERILIIAQAPFYSHVSVIRELSLALNKRGHEIVMVTPFPTKNLSLANYTEIDFSSNLKVAELADVQSTVLGYQTNTKLQSNRSIYRFISLSTKIFYALPEIKNIYAKNSKEKFDLVIAEAVLSHGISFLAHKLKAPLISIFSVDLHLIHHFMTGNHLLPSHPSNWEFYGRTGPEMPFWVRVQNFIHALLIVRQWYTYETGSFYDIVKEYLGNDIPSPFDIIKNISLILVNHDTLLTHARPMLPNVIGYNNFKIMETPLPLATDMAEFLGTASEGFIYMSLGSTLNSTMLPNKTVTTIFNVFSRLPYKVIWKFGRDLPKNQNIFTSDWIPQQSVLAHRNIKLFIYQGGLQSTEETIHYGVPIVGIPIMFDQLFRVKKLVSLGVGRMLDFTEFDEETFQEAVIDVLNNKRYKTKMLELRDLTKDKPYNSKDHAVWWVEYVIRHKGAPHLRFSGADEPWYQRYDMDVIAFLSIMFFIVTLICVIVLLRILRWCFRYCMYKSRYPSSDRKKNKIE